MPHTGLFSLPVTYVLYDPNGGVGGTVDMGLISGTSYTVKSAEAAEVSRPGYLFVAWNMQQDGGGITYAPGQVITLTMDLTLYAQWVEIPVETFTVIYYPNGGIGGHIDSDLAEGSLYTIKTPAQANVTRAGYTFAGWNTAANGTGDAYAPGETFPIDADLTLYAQWQIISYTVTYYPNGGYGFRHEDNVDANSGYTIRSSADVGFYWSGYVFVDWNTEPDGSGRTYSPGEVITIHGDLTLYAQWRMQIIG